MEGPLKTHGWIARPRGRSIEVAKFYSAAALALALQFSFSFAHADTPGPKRVALVIGNSTFQHYPQLANPAHDAEDMSAQLRRLGFEVIERQELTSHQIGATLREFRLRLAGAEVGLVFLAGHGMQINGENFFPGVDADIASEEDVPNQSLALRQVMEVLEGAKTQLNLVFLDACRDNPFAHATRSGTRGLARMEATSGTLISYATRPGSVAHDGSGRNGVYTAELLRQMRDSADLPIETVLKRVVTGVKLESGGLQEPWWEGSLEGDFCFGQCGVATRLAAEAMPPPSVETAASVSKPAGTTPATQAPQRLKTAHHNAPPAATRAVSVSVADLEPMYFTRAFSRNETGSIYRLEAGRSIELHARTTPGNEGVYSIAESPRGEMYFCDATEARIFKLDGKRETVVYQHNRPIKHLAFDPTGRFFFSSVMGSDDGGSIYELVGGKPVLFYTLPVNATGGAWSGTFAFDRQGMLWLSSGSRRPGSLYRARFNELEKVYTSSQTGIMGFSFLNDGSIAFADNDHSVMHLTLPSLQLTKLFESSYEGWLTDVKLAAVAHDPALKAAIKK